MPFTHKIRLFGYKFHRLDLYNSKRLLTKAVDLINNEIKPGLVLITGDIVHDKSDTEAYRWAFNELQKLNVPYVVVPGDHDIDKDGTKNKEQSWFKPGPFPVVYQKYKIIGLPPFPSDKDIDWLKSELDRSKEYEVIVCHHRMLKIPFIMKVFSKLSCPVRAPGAKKILRLLSQYDNIRLVLTGHSHTNYVSTHYVSGKKKIKYITTTSLAEYPFEIRLIWISDKDITTKVYSISR